MGDAIQPRPAVVLVDENTASAAEILAAALADYGLAKVVGGRTYGKGTFQEVIELENGGALDLTVGEYLTSEDVSLAGKGIKPDVAAADKPATKPDEALDAALAEVAERAQLGVDRSSAASVTDEPTGLRGRAPRQVPRRRADLRARPAAAAAQGRGAPGRGGDGAGRGARERRPAAARARLAEGGARRRRGAARRPRARARLPAGGRDRGRRGAGDRPRRRPAPPRPDRAAHVHRRPGHRPRLRRRGLGRARRATVSGSGSTSRTSRRTCGRAARSRPRRPRARPASTSRARSSRCCRTRSARARAASSRASSGSRSPPRST